MYNSKQKFENLDIDFYEKMLPKCTQEGLENMSRTQKELRKSPKRYKETCKRMLITALCLELKYWSLKEDWVNMLWYI